MQCKHILFWLPLVVQFTMNLHKKKKIIIFYHSAIVQFNHILQPRPGDRQVDNVSA